MYISSEGLNESFHCKGSDPEILAKQWRV